MIADLTTVSANSEEKLGLKQLRCSGWFEGQTNALSWDHFTLSGVTEAFVPREKKYNNLLRHLKYNLCAKYKQHMLEIKLNYAPPVASVHVLLISPSKIVG